VNRVIYLREGREHDQAVERALIEAGCVVEHTSTIVDTLRAVYTHSQSQRKGLFGKRVRDTLLIVAEVQSGGIPLMMVMREELTDAPSVMLVDRSGGNVRAAVQALQLGASEYLLGSDPASARAERTLELVERMRASTTDWLDDDAPLDLDLADAGELHDDVSWDPVSHVIKIDGEQLHLTPIQARIFDRLWANRNSTVSLEELIRLVLLRPDVDIREGSRLLRPHLVRLRNTLDSHPKLARRIVNIRGNGYMMI
jgi:DNA-binding response OmpR family regulator